MKKFEIDTVLKYLTKYKIDVLRINENGYSKRYKKYYDHILPAGRETDNFIESKYKLELINEINNHEIKLHKDFHHLNSSQALCLNLFSPIVYEERYEPLLHLLKSNDSIINSKFEYIENNKGEERTNFDFFMKGERSNYYFELKYTEREFGSVVENDNYVATYEKIYKNKMMEIGINDKIYFFKNYQILRNLFYAENGMIIFVIPGFRNDLEKKINEVIKKSNVKDKIKIIYIENIVKSYQAVNMSSMDEHYMKFMEKYFGWEKGSYV